MTIKQFGDSTECGEIKKKIICILAYINNKYNNKYRYKYTIKLNL